MTGPERDELYARLAAMRPAFAGYESRSDRLIPDVPPDPDLPKRKGTVGIELHGVATPRPSHQRPSKVQLVGLKPRSAPARGRQRDAA